ncbi:RNA-guided endonuclease IscB [Oribacterium sp. NK2B42]|uniref:RNA-guided endonuclease IscB n=1 Tax=Oribacterium sp. NK2B42 TaxID=689781 RepID=UPI0003F769B7|nr:RNA-guided endonuclease IscB [Oribacterium sp. NK2B42]
MVYVISKDRHPLMPTMRYGKVRRMLKSGLAKVINRYPFTIQLLYNATDYTQDVLLGVDAGSKNIGLSATTIKKVLFEAKVTLRNDIVELIGTRREQRRTRRNRKTRYRKPRFDNRKRSNKWLAPSVRQKMESHINMVQKVHKILPVSRIKVETASFDIKKIKAPNIQGTDYQNGEQTGFWNTREYVLWRDGHVCQCCKGKSKDKILNVHHIESRKTGGDSPDNLVTLCEYCHKQYHMGKIKLPKTIRRGMSFRDASFMGIMRWAVYDRLKGLYPDVSLTYGYITKNTRIRNNLPKDHHIDARCISGNPTAESDGTVYIYKKVRCHNRQIHKCKILKGNIRKRNQAPYKVHGFRLYDKVLYNNELYTIYGRRASGFFDIRKPDGTKVNNGSISCKKLKLVAMQHGYIVDMTASA